jgi:ABC-type nitrate/sulfonate/bicarbonate transport system ATPase subunit
MLLGEVSARFPKQHFAAILGPSGVEKSTLLKVIAGLREATLADLLGRTRSRRGRHGSARDRLRAAVQHRLRVADVWESVKRAAAAGAKA